MKILIIFKKTYVYQCLIFVLLYNTSIANLFSLNDNMSIMFNDNIVTSSKSLLDSNIVVIRVTFYGLRSSRTCLGSIVRSVNDVLGSSVESLSVFTARLCLSYQNNKLETRKIKSMSIHKINDSKHPLVFNFNRNHKLTIHKRVYKNGTLSLSYNNSVVSFSIEDENRTVYPIDNFKKIGLDIVNSGIISPDDQQQYYLPEFTTSSIYPVVLLFDISNLITYYRGEGFLMTLDTDRNVNIDKFIRQNIGGPVLKCKTEQNKQYCSILLLMWELLA